MNEKKLRRVAPVKISKFKTNKKIYEVIFSLVPLIASRDKKIVMISVHNISRLIN